MNLKYYLYISDTKLDMLYGQIPEPLLRRLAREATIDLKVLKFSLKDQPTDENRYGRLSVVTKHLARDGHITELHELPGPWVQGTVAARWTRANEAVLFAGTRGDTLIGLIGSIKHVLGGFGSASSSTSGTAAAILEMYKSQAATAGDNIATYESLAFLEDLIGDMVGGEQRMQFLARKLDYKPSVREYGRRVILATPLYVALST